MIRLTMKIEEGFYTTSNINSTDDLKYKLGKLEDIEEQIEMDLITLFEIYNKMCEQKFVYIKIGNEIKFEYYDSYVIDFKNKEIIGMEYEPIGFFSFKDYGITWAVSREELENETSI